MDHAGNALPSPGVLAVATGDDGVDPKLAASGEAIHDGGMKADDVPGDSEEVTHCVEVRLWARIDGVVKIAGQPSEIIGASAETPVRWPGRARYAPGTHLGLLCRSPR
jgi:hypothetical protein